jgi:hypothetical protein
MVMIDRERVLQVRCGISADDGGGVGMRLGVKLMPAQDGQDM